jgi:CRP-like cAMP-binding protein
LFKVLEEYHDANQQKIMKMLKAMPLLDGWRDENFFGLIRQMKVVPLVRNDIIFDVGDPCDQVFIVKNGEVEVNKKKFLISYSYRKW